jgi:hypothetical protein
VNGNYFRNGSTGPRPIVVATDPGIATRAGGEGSAFLSPFSKACGRRRIGLIKGGFGL